MAGLLFTWGFRVLLGAAVFGAIWYGVDRVVGAFRDRAALSEKLVAANAANLQAVADRHAAITRAAAVAESASAELKARDDAARKTAAANRRIERELTDAQSRLAAWQAGADADLARCLAQPVPRWLLDGSGSTSILAGPEPGVPEARSPAR